MLKIETYKGKGKLEYSYPCNRISLTKGKRTCIVFLTPDNKTIRVLVSNSHNNDTYRSVDISFSEFRVGLLDIIEKHKEVK